jgi:hypothetical protein
MSDSGKQIGDCHHHLTRVDCPICLAQEEAARYRACLEMIAQIRAISGSAQGNFRSTLRMVDAVLKGADVRELATVESIEKGNWKP